MMRFEMSFETSDSIKTIFGPIFNFQSVNLQSEQNAVKKDLCEAVGKLHDTVRALCPNKSLPVIENVCRSPKKTPNSKIPVQPSRSIFVPTAAALKMGVGFPLTNLPGTSDDTNRILSTQCQQQCSELLNECGICKQVNDQHCLAKCDTCYLYYHLGCLSPPLTRHPKKSKIYGWQCSECDEDNPDGVVTLASGPRKSRIKKKYSKDGTIVPLETNQTPSNTAESAPLSPSSNQSDKKPALSIEKNKSPASSAASPSTIRNVSSPPLSEKRAIKRRFHKKTITLPRGGREFVCSKSTVSLVNIGETVKSLPSKKHRKKLKTTEQRSNTANIAQCTDSNNITANKTTELAKIAPENGAVIESVKGKCIETEAKSSDIVSLSHKVNRKRRKEKHRSKERSERSSSKERKKKRKRKNHDEHKSPDRFTMADGVPKIKIKVN